MGLILIIIGSILIFGGCGVVAYFISEIIKTKYK